MSTELYYSVPINHNIQSAQANQVARAEAAQARQAHSAQGFGPGGINMYHQQQLQAALYQQQQVEFAQHHAQLEMHLQLEQMRLQNLALQEQIMIGQVHAHQQAQVQAEQQLRNTLYASAKPQTSRPTFNHAQGGMLAERALARRQQAQADALYAQYYPQPDEHQADSLHDSSPPLQVRSHGDRTGSQSPPAVVVSRPDEVFSVFAPAEAKPVRITPAAPKVTTQAHRSVSAAATVETRKSPSSPATATVQHTPMVTPGKKFSEVVKSSPPAANVAVAKSASALSISTTTLAPKLNPFSSVFVPASATSGSSSDMDPTPVTASTSQTEASTPASEDCLDTPTMCQGGPLNIYRGSRANSPPASKPTRHVSAPMSSTIVQSLMGAMPTRQPRGPAAEAELTNQNFATRIRKRAIGAIRVMGSRPSTASDPPSATHSIAGYPHLQQQQLLEAMMVQQQQQHQQQQLMMAAGYLEADMGFHPSMVSPGGIAHLMATARAREERYGF